MAAVYFILLLFTVQVIAHYKETNVTKYPNLPLVNGFSWSNCGSASDPVKIKVLQVEPDPIEIPGNLSLGIDVILSENITVPTPVKVSIEKKVAFFWVKVPCEKGLGSCNYDDICKVIKKLNKCPEAFKKYKLPCKCPVKINHYVLPLSNIVDLTKVPIPKWLEDGEYKAQITINNSKGERLTCTQVNFQLKADLRTS